MPMPSYVMLMPCLRAILFIIRVRDVDMPRALAIAGRGATLHYALLSDDAMKIARGGYARRHCRRHAFFAAATPCHMAAATMSIFELMPMMFDAATLD